MSHLPIRPLKAFSLSGVYVITSALPIAIAFSINKPATAQTPLPPSTTPSNSRPTSTDLVEQARQRLRDRGELPAANSGNVVVTTVPAPPPPVTPVPVPSLPQAPFETYRLGPGDVISVVVQRFQDLNFQATIDQDGNITAPLLGRLSIRGLTVEQAQDRVRQNYNRYVVDPVVFLALTNPRPVLVTLSGEIARPGQYPLQLPRVSSALLTAGGATAQADLRSVRVKRPLVDGTILEQKLDLFSPLKDGNPLPDLRLQDGDVIVISKLESDQDYDRTLASKSTLVKPQINVRILSYASGGLGNVTLPNGSTFLDALTAARPNPDRTNFRRVALVRFDPIQKKAVSREIDAKKILAGDPTQNIALEDNDVIVVGRNLVGKITYALNTVTQPFRDVLGFLLFFRELRNGASDLFGPTGRDDD
jgi:polysaccharide biosynthesis/export protein